MNTKGGCGKTTIATNLASYCAEQGHATALFDYDRQGSSTRWLNTRSNLHPEIHGVAAYLQPQPGTTRSWQMRIPADTDYVITDTPAGFADIDVEDRVAEADIILVPVLPSAIDIQITTDFIGELKSTGEFRDQNKRLGIVINRNRTRNRSSENLEAFLESLDIPVVGRIRDTQHYVKAAETGVGIHELEARDAGKDVIAWEHLLTWINAPLASEAHPKVSIG